MDSPRPVMIMLLTIGLLGYAAADERLDVANRDTEWDWDMLYDEYENEFWVCRGVQTQELADDHLCSRNYSPRRGISSASAI